MVLTLSGCNKIKAHESLKFARSNECFYVAIYLRINCRAKIDANLI